MEGNRTTVKKERYVTVMVEIGETRSVSDATFLNAAELSTRTSPVCKERPECGSVKL